MTKAFVFGKFLPFHKGHEAMIFFALQHCDFLSILVCCSDKEPIDGETRKRWILETLSANRADVLIRDAGSPEREEYRNNEHAGKEAEVKIFNYKEDEVPNSSVSSRSVSETWSAIFTKLYPGYSLLVTSEPYGSFVAEYMNIRHLPFDIPRKNFPVSASAVRNNLFAYWRYLPDPVKRYYAIRVVVLGTESTGKTTLCNKLAQHFECSLVTEAGRDLVADSRSFIFNDLIKIADEHAKRIREVLLTDSPLVIIDTDIHITKSYSRFVFDRELEVSADIYQDNHAQLYIYLDKNIPYIQDGTRLDEAQRNLLDDSHRQVLTDHKITFAEVGGDWEQRFQQAKNLIQAICY